jgi:hypothetical protein
LEERMAEQMQYTGVHCVYQYLIDVELQMCNPFCMPNQQREHDQMLTPSVEHNLYGQHTCWM